MNSNIIWSFLQQTAPRTEVVYLLQKRSPELKNRVVPPIYREAAGGGLLRRRELVSRQFWPSPVTLVPENPYLMRLRERPPTEYTTAAATFRARRRQGRRKASNIYVEVVYMHWNEHVTDDIMDVVYYTPPSLTFLFPMFLAL